METDIKCPYCGRTAFKNVAYSGNFYGSHKCRKCKKIFSIELYKKPKNDKIATLRS